MGYIALLYLLRGEGISGGKRGKRTKGFWDVGWDLRGEDEVSQMRMVYSFSRGLGLRLCCELGSV